MSKSKKKPLAQLSSYSNSMWYQWKRNNWFLRPQRFINSYSSIEIDRPIFFVGNQGGGLTLASRMIRRHPEVVSVTGNSQYWAGADEMQKVMLVRLPPSLRLGGRMLFTDQYHDQFSPPRSWSYGSDDLVNFYRKTADDYNEDASNCLRFIIREAIARHGDRSRTVRFVDKSQVFSLKMTYVDALLKDTNPHFVLVVRNPYAACYRAAIGKAGDMRRYATKLSLDERVEICSQHWANSIEAALNDGPKVSNFIAMRFEDIVSTPKESLQRLCTAVSLPFIEDLVPAPHHKIPFGSSYEGRWYPLRKNVNDQYLDAVPDKYVDIISARCKALANEFGYKKPK